MYSIVDNSKSSKFRFHLLCKRRDENDIDKLVQRRIELKGQEDKKISEIFKKITRVIYIFQSNLKSFIVSV